VQAQGARVVTPEAVVLEVGTAGLGSRILARAIDVAIQAGMLFVLFVVLGAVAVSASDAALGTAGLVITLIVATLVIFGYPVIWESLWRGRTPGKAALGLRVVTRQGAPIRFRHALVRGLVGMVEVMALPPVGVISMLFSTEDQRLGDMAAGTLVIRERAGAQMSVPVAFFPPVGWESYVDSLDVGAMSSAEYETVRAFLLRTYEMAPLPRSNLAARLAGPLVTRLHQPVPETAGPELWLVCVACAYQRRHGGPGPLPPAPWVPSGAAPPPSLQTVPSWAAPDMRVPEVPPDGVAGPPNQGGFATPD
jgi:uncharacterized RDD family membrane protein YckC